MGAQLDCRLILVTWIHLLLVCDAALEDATVEIETSDPACHSHICSPPPPTTKLERPLRIARRTDPRQTKSGRSPTLRLLRAVDELKAYATLSLHACLKAWRQVHHRVWRHRDGKFSVDEHFYQRLNEFKNGQFRFAAKDDERYKLMEKIAQDVARCESVGRGGFRLTGGRLRESQEEASVEEEQTGDDPSGPPPRAREPKRRRAHGDGEGGDDEVLLRAHRRKVTPVQPKAVVDHASDEQFLDLMREHVPHLADDKAAAWGSVMNALPAENALSNFALHGLKMRFNSLNLAMDRGTRQQRAKLTPAIDAKLQAYRMLVEARTEDPGPQSTSEPTPTPMPPTARVVPVTRATRSTSHPPPPPPPISVVEGAARDEAFREAVLALAAHVEKNAHREAVMLHKNAHREAVMLHEETMKRAEMAMRRTEMVQRLIKLYNKSRSVDAVDGEERSG